MRSGSSSVELLSVVFGVVLTWMLLTRPLETFLALGWLLGFYATFFGAMMILLGLRLRRANHTEYDKAPGIYQRTGI